MNRKIFTLLACALMLFSTAFTINAKVVGGNLPVGDIVRKLPLGEDKGMYHIRIDSIYRSGAWLPVGGPDGVTNFFGLPGLATDTVILGVTERGRVIPVSANHLRTGTTDDITYTDLQSTMWCIEIVQEPDLIGQYKTFHFKNKVFGKDLNFSSDDGYVAGDEQGWIYSISNDPLENNMPLRRLTSDGQYDVLAYNSNGGGYVSRKRVSIANYLLGGVNIDMLKFSIVEVAPIVLDAAAFNTKLGGEEKLVTLQFENPQPNSKDYPNFFGYPLKATDDPDLKDYGYLNLYINGSDTVIYNRDSQYTNDLGLKYLRIFADGKYAAADNKSYRFVYFPSQDSLVINAYRVNHSGHGSIADGEYTDEVAEKGDSFSNYSTDNAGEPLLYYGLYTPEIQDQLIVRRQDLYGLNAGTSLMTIGKHPANTRIYFGGINCSAIELDAWTPTNGIYTIWDERGYFLGVRPYNGAIAAQWIKPRPGECPDRIPSYQWVIERVEGNYTKRVNITNREFGTIGSDYVKMRNVLISEEPSQLFRNQGQFNYYPFQDQVDNFESITYALVAGRYLAVDPATSCVMESSSGFRPVNSNYVREQHLGYKFFRVETDVNSISFGKSEDVVGSDGASRGMDYNAFAFNYLHEYLQNSSSKSFIDLTESEGDSVLFVNQNGQEGFQFRLGAPWNDAARNFAPESYGYPSGTFPAHTITDPKTGYSYSQVAAPGLIRYSYEMKVADFYNYRDGLAEQYVVLKGASDKGTDLANKFNYGVADVHAYEQPYKFANVYLRESYFLVEGKSDNEERSRNDPSRRIYYALIDRVESSQFNTLANMGYEILDVIRGQDPSVPEYGLLMLRVDPVSGIIRGVTKTIANEVMSTFSLENMNYPLYRRLRSINDDGAIEGSLDAPKILRFRKQANNKLFLYEDGISSVSDNLGINFLGQANIDDCPENELASDGTYKYNYNLLVDTAFINRGTGWIKPQYLIAVGCEVVEDWKDVPYLDDCEEPQTREIMPYIRGRYLINATDSARDINSDASPAYPIRDRRYITSTSWNRLAFVDAIHVDDRLYIVSQLQKAGIQESDYIVKADDGELYVDGGALRKMTEEDGVLFGTARIPGPGGSGRYGSYYDFKEWNNYHNDVCFSLRFVNTYAENPDEKGIDRVDNKAKAFMIESETTDRNPYGNRKIAPVQGGWIMLDNGVPAVSHIAYEAAIGQAEIFNVDKASGDATSNDPVSSDSRVKVISGIDEISVQNVAGKQVTITNLLGQIITNVVPNSDNITVKAPKGIVIVTVKGEKAVKSIVK